MEENEIMTTEELEVVENTDTIEEIETSCSGNGVKTVVGIGLIAGLSWLGYKYVVKPIKAKLKAKKEQKVNEDKLVEVDETESEVNDEE